MQTNSPTNRTADNKSPVTELNNHLKHRQQACARAIAADVTVSLEPDAPARHFTLAQAVSTRPDSDISLERGINDAIALTARLHDQALHQSLRPDSVVAARLFDEMERARCQAAGIGWMLGVSSNLQVLWQHQITQKKYKSGSHTEQLHFVFSYLTRHALGLQCNLPEDSRLTIAQWQNPVITAAGHLWGKLKPLKDNQSAFANVALDIIALINEDTSTHHPHCSEADLRSNKKSEDEGIDQESTESDDDEAIDETDSHEKENEHEEAVISDDHKVVFEEDTTHSRDEAVNSETETQGTALNSETLPYTSYSAALDEIVYAKNLYSAAERNTLRTTLDEHIELHSKVVGKLAGQLQRLLMAQQNRHWKFDLEEGLLDATRLTRIITQPHSSLSFKQESDTEFKDTVVTLLVDNSKSMLGKPIAIAASCADILTQTLERCGISVEILGFTTTELHGGPLFRRWKEDGKSQDPGRLNGLRHIIYKPADVSYRRARSGFGVMLHKDLLKQNIDGEALLWASERLRHRPEERKILLVISDGAPIDTSTQSANRENYLIDHLHQVIASIETTKKVELLAIGIGHDVSHYYQHAITIRAAKDLGKTLLSQFRSLFSPLEKPVR